MTDRAGDDRYDAVVIGSGFGGLPTAALLAKAGWRVAVVERQDGPGGLGRAFRRGPYVFDPALHFTVEAHDGGAVDQLLRHLEVRDKCDLVPIDDAWAAAFPGLDVRVAPDRESLIASYGEAFPSAAREVSDFFATCFRFFDESTYMTMSIGLKKLDDAAARFPTLFRYRNATVADVLDDFVQDPRARAACAAVWPYMGAPPSRLSFYVFVKIVNTLTTGAYYSRGSFQRYADAFADAFLANGGELLLGRPVERILVEEGRTAGVVVEGGQTLRAPVVVSNADAHQTFVELIGLDALPERFVRRFRRLEPSISAFVVYAATTLDLSGHAHETLLFTDWDHDVTFDGVRRGHPGGMWATVATLIDTSLAPAGEHLVTLSSLAAYDIGEPWETARERVAAEMLAAFDERLFPGLRDSLVHVENATPRGIEQLTGNHRGAAYGWEHTPAQSGGRRISHEGPIPGLYLSGHWTVDSPGSFNGILSSVRTARIVLEHAGHGDRAPVFQAADMPLPV